MAVETAVMKQTSAMATLYALHDRGVVARGYKADLNVIDLPRLAVHRPQYVNDLPEGASRWIQAVDGYDLTMLSGAVTFQHGRHTGALPGGLVRNPRSRGASARQAQGLRPYQELLSEAGRAASASVQQQLQAEEGGGAGRDLAATLGTDNAGYSAVGRAIDMIDEAEDTARARL